MGVLEGISPRPPAGQMNSLARTALKYAVVGVIGVLVNSITLAALYEGAHMPLFLSSALAVEMAIISNFLLNDRWTFARRRPSVRRFLKFNLATVAALAITPSIVWLLVAVEVHYLTANLIAIIATAGVNFATSAFWVWKPPGGGERAWSPFSWQSSSSFRSG